MTLPARLQHARISLLQHGWAVVDDALTEEQGAQLRGALEACHSAGALRQHRFGFRPSATAAPAIYAKPNIFEAELADAPVRSAAP